MWSLSWQINAHISSLVPAMSCRRLGAKPISGPMPGYLFIGKTEKKNQKLQNEENASSLLHAYLSCFNGFNSLWPGDAIWRLRSWSTSAWAMACCSTAPSHYPGRYWLMSHEIFMTYVCQMNLKLAFLEITAAVYQDPRVNPPLTRKIDWSVDQLAAVYFRSFYSIITTLRSSDKYIHP